MILLIDGRSGSGKTELANLIAAGGRAQLLRLDDVYPGWGGLAQASAQLPEILRTRRWQRYDWATSSLAEWHDLSDSETHLVVEGCGALSRASRALADFGIWVRHPAADRKRRALARQPTFAQHWRDWALQEDAHEAREHPQVVADAVVDGADVSVGLDRWRAMLGA